MARDKRERGTTRRMAGKVARETRIGKPKESKTRRRRMATRKGLGRTRTG